MRNWVSSCLIALCATAAAASPDRTATVTDRLFAISDSTLLVIRDIAKHQGSAAITETDSVLLAVNLETGGADTMWPIDRVSADAATGEVLFAPIPDPANPYAIRRTMAAAPLGEPMQPTVPASNGALTVDPLLVTGDPTKDGVRITSAEGQTFALAWPDAYARLVLTVMISSNVIPITLQDSPSDIRPANFVSLESCTISGAFLTQTHGDLPIALARLTCEGTGYQSHTWLVIPPA